MCEKKYFEQSSRMIKSTSEIILSFYQKERITEQVHNDANIKNKCSLQKILNNKRSKQNDKTSLRTAVDFKNECRPDEQIWHPYRIRTGETN